MRANRLGKLVIAIAITLWFTAAAWGAAHENVLYSFKLNQSDGYMPFSRLVMDTDGNLFGTTSGGGIHNHGTVFELISNGGGSYTEHVLHSFGATDSDGIGPMGGLIADGQGNYFGTTTAGGIHNGGTLYELSPRIGGGFTVKVLHSFGNGFDGEVPYGELVMDGSGNLYGTTQFGGIHLCPDTLYCGTVFEMSPAIGGGWSEKVLHSFNNNGSDGYWPLAGLVLDSVGNLYGTTWQGGVHDKGFAFQLSPKSDGTWQEKALHSFGNGTDGFYLFAPLVIDPAGNLFGVTNDGGIHPCTANGNIDCGTVFMISPGGNGSWSETVIHNFGNGSDGQNPYGGLVLDAAGNLYGTTYWGGIHADGTTFEMSPRIGGGWTETVLHSFNDNGVDAAAPAASMMLDSSGDLYGTSAFGGTNYIGAVFKITP